jgi:hypothetical protein
MFDNIYMISISIVSYLVIIGYLQLALQLVSKREGRDVIYKVAKIVRNGRTYLKMRKLVRRRMDRQKYTTEEQERD